MLTKRQRRRIKEDMSAATSETKMESAVAGKRKKRKKRERNRGWGNHRRGRKGNTVPLSMKGDRHE